MLKQNKKVWCLILFKVMKAAADSSVILDGKRHHNGMKIDDKVYIYANKKILCIYLQKVDGRYLIEAG